MPCSRSFRSRAGSTGSTDLAEIPAKFGVNNVYGEIGTSFATCAVSSPPLAAALVGTLVRGLGADHVAWGTDSVWYGSPQWQIEAFRRLEIPVEMQKNNQFAPLGAADGLVKTAILGGNSARLYRVDVKSAQSGITTDKIASIKAEYVAMGGLRSNTRYGYVARPHADRQAQSHEGGGLLLRPRGRSPRALSRLSRARSSSILSAAGRRSAEDPADPAPQSNRIVL